MDRYLSIILLLKLTVARGFGAAAAAAGEENNLVLLIKRRRSSKICVMAHYTATTLYSLCNAMQCEGKGDKEKKFV